MSLGFFAGRLKVLIIFFIPISMLFVGSTVAALSQSNAFKASIKPSPFDSLDIYVSFDDRSFDSLNVDGVNSGPSLGMSEISSSSKRSLALYNNSEEREVETQVNFPSEASDWKTVFTTFCSVPNLSGKDKRGYNIHAGEDDCSSGLKDKIDKAFTVTIKDHNNSDFAFGTISEYIAGTATINSNTFALPSSASICSGDKVPGCFSFIFDINFDAISDAGDYRYSADMILPLKFEGNVRGDALTPVSGSLSKNIQTIHGDGEEPKLAYSVDEGSSFEDIDEYVNLFELTSLPEPEDSISRKVFLASRESFTHKDDELWLQLYEASLIQELKHNILDSYGKHFSDALRLKISAWNAESEDDIITLFDGTISEIISSETNNTFRVKLADEHDNTAGGIEVEFSWKDSDPFYFEKELFIDMPLTAVLETDVDTRKLHGFSYFTLSASLQGGIPTTSFKEIYYLNEASNLAVDMDDKLWIWGRGSLEDFGVPSTMYRRNIIILDTPNKMSHFHEKPDSSDCLKVSSIVDKGYIYCALDEGVKKVSVGLESANLLLTKENKFLGWGNAKGLGRSGSDLSVLGMLPAFTEGDVVAPEQVKDFYSGNHHNLVLDKEGHVYFSGDPIEGISGETRGDSYQVTSLTNTIEGFPGRSNALSGASFIRNEDSEIEATGNNEFGELGTGTTENAPNFMPVSDTVKSAFRVEAMKNSTIFINKDGSARAAGNSDYRILGNSGLTSMDRIKLYNNMSEEIARDASIVDAYISRYGHSLLLDTNGKAYAAGLNRYGRFGIPVSSLTRYDNFTLIGDPDKKYVAIGLNNNASFLIDTQCQTYAAGYKLHLGAGALPGETNNIDKFVKMRHKPKDGCSIETPSLTEDMDPPSVTDINTETDSRAEDLDISDDSMDNKTATDSEREHVDVSDKYSERDILGEKTGSDSSSDNNKDKTNSSEDDSGIENSIEENEDSDHISDNFSKDIPLPNVNDRETLDPAIRLLISGRSRILY